MSKTRQTNAAETAGADGQAEALVPEPLTTAQIEELQNRAAKADENWDRLLRATADFDNFKKRAARDRDDAIKYANESLIKKLVTVLDNFDMALAAGQNQAGSPQSFQAGVAMINQQLRNALVESGLEEVDATGKVF